MRVTFYSVRQHCAAQKQNKQLRTKIEQEEQETSTRMEKGGKENPKKKNAFNEMAIKIAFQ